MEQLSLFDEQLDVLSPEDELIETGLLRGSGFVDGKKRIYEYASTNPSPEDFSKFLSNEYGVGGYGGLPRDPNQVHREWHDGKGIKFEGFDRDGNKHEISLKWIEVAKRILRMVEKGTYI